MSEQVDLTTIPISPEGGNHDGGSSSEDTGKKVTVFHDKDNFNVKHPLSNRWTLWFTKPASGKVCTLVRRSGICTVSLTVCQGDNWNDLLKEVITFESVEEFWGIYVGFPRAGRPGLVRRSKVTNHDNRTISLRSPILL
jgi:translation initiation factor 4E